MAGEVDTFIANLNAWGDKIDAKAKAIIPSFTTSGSSKKLARSFKHKIKLAFGVPDRVQFRFKRYGIYFNYGVGRGQAIGNQAAGKRVATDWYGKVITDNDIAELQNIVAEYDQNLVINAFRL